MKGKHFFNVGREEDKIFLEFSVKCTDCDAGLVHKLMLNKVETAHLAVDLLMKLDLAEDLQQALVGVIGQPMPIEGNLATKH